jgi:hypothetical protein
MNELMHNIKDLTKEGVESLFSRNLHCLCYDSELTELSFWQMYHIYDKCLKDTNLGVFISPSGEGMIIKNQVYFFSSYEYDSIKEFKNHINELSKTDNKSLFVIGTIGYLRGSKKIYLKGREIEDYKEYECEEFKKHFNNRRKNVINNLLDSV